MSSVVFVCQQLLVSLRLNFDIYLPWPVLIWQKMLCRKIAICGSNAHMKSAQ